MSITILCIQYSNDNHAYPSVHHMPSACLFLFYFCKKKRAREKSAFLPANLSRLSVCVFVRLLVCLTFLSFRAVFSNSSRLFALLIERLRQNTSLLRLIRSVRAFCWERIQSCVRWMDMFLHICATDIWYSRSCQLSGFATFDQV